MRGSSAANTSTTTGHTTEITTVVSHAPLSRYPSASYWGKKGSMMPNWIAGATAMHRANPVVAPNAPRNRYARGERTRGAARWCASRMISSRVPTTHASTSQSPPPKMKAMAPATVASASAPGSTRCS
ncbi:hypothetical protein [Mycolicibacterium tokaiense]|uniref:hypothetical protein n=1 Tax=Mycolicibacterium tokaiense TaxID=39695 RepID=UPI001559F34B|nr:hypothetical protein [Mycolicibacterium tokaiense]